MVRTDYDVWKCLKCGREFRTRAVPHQPECRCGEGAWWQRFEQGPPYTVSDEKPETDG